MLTIGKKPQKNLYKTLDSVQEQCYIINIQKHLNTKGAKTMLVKEFLGHLQSNLKVIIFDTDKKPGSQRKTDDAGALAIEYHFNNTNVVDDFSIFENVIYIYTSRH